MLFVDSNIFMYATGGEHPCKIPSIRFFERLASGKDEIAINTEILQEILYRFWAIKKMDQGFELFDYASALSEWVFPITQEGMSKAKGILANTPQLGPRDSLHVATMLENRVATIVSYDRHFDLVREIKRIEPA